MEPVSLFFFLIAIDDPKETRVGPSDLRYPSEQKQSGDSGADGHLGHQTDDKGDHGPRYVGMLLPVPAHIYWGRKIVWPPLCIHRETEARGG